MNSDFVDWFIPVQAELFEQIGEGELNPTEFACYMMILFQADYETGFWRGSAPKLEVAWAGQIAERSIQVALKSLCEKGFLKSFHRKGVRSNYLVAIHNYMIRFGDFKGFRLNALATVHSNDPIYEPVTKPISKRQRKRSEGTANQECNDSETTAQTERTDSAVTGATNAGIPDSSRCFQNIQEYPAPPDPPHIPDLSRTNTNWLVGRVENLLSKRLNKATKTSTYDEWLGLGELERQHGTLVILLAVHQFLTFRTRGFEGVDFPVTVFLKEAGQWVAKVHERIKDWGEDPDLDPEDREQQEAEFKPIRAMCQKYDYPTDAKSIALLMGLNAFEVVTEFHGDKRNKSDADLNADEYERMFERRRAYGLAAVEDFLKSNPVSAKTRPRPGQYLAPLGAVMGISG